MTITTVSPETAIPEHFASCTETATGRRVAEFIGIYGADRIMKLGALTDNLDLYRGECRCYDIQLRAVEADLTVARRAQKAGRDKTSVIADLTARRDALRQAVSR